LANTSSTNSGRLPDPRLRNPLIFPNGAADPATVFLSCVIDHPNIEIGDWTYYNDRDLPDDYAGAIAPYLFPGAPEELRIGKFCQIAQGVQFLTATANHPMTGLSTFPFAIYDPPRLKTYRSSLPRGRDNVVGHDCWIGREASANARHGIGERCNSLLSGGCSGNCARLCDRRRQPCQGHKKEVRRRDD